MNDNVGTSFEKLVSIMAKLRAPDGCPWDREQTHQTLKKYLLEETYEVLEAIDAGNMAELKTELGDLMLQILFHAQIAAEKGVFNIKDVLEAISEKLIRRHPHVFGDAKVACAEEVLHRWEEIKACEPGYEKRKSILDGVPKTLPALARAMEISKRAAGAGFEWPDMHAVLEKVREEISELENEIQIGNKERIADEIGDLLFTVVNVARWAKVDPEDALRRMIDRFIERFKQIEEVAQSSGRQLSQMSIEEMDAIWDRAKTQPN
ncbi:MAG: nucleoside triphosphate pyrophosphohydrolase [Armatimonadota bacterium]|nr:nucleoside triphosphate pyrophosphohydrolase [Armatimonadota bacterium]